MVRHFGRIGLVVLALALAIGVANAGNTERIGTGAALELRVPAGSRGTALGGSVLASVKGIESLYWNPAGLASGDSKREVVFSYLDYMADMQMNYFAMSTQVRGDISLGVSAKVFSVGDIIVTTEENPEGTGEVLSPTFSVVGMTYSQRFTDRVSFGATVKYIHEGIAREVANGLAFDFGFQYITGLEGLTLAVAMRNFGPDIKFDGPDLDREIELADALTGADPQAGSRNFRTALAPSELPTTVELGLSYKLYENPMGTALFTATFRNNNLASDEYQAGIEYAVKDMLNLRGGYIASPTGKAQLTGYKKQFILGPTFGFGVKVPMGSARFVVDYAYGATEFFQDNHWVTVSLGF